MMTPPDSAPRIRVLSPELADQIAAGEVVERPASVVKELCENALDAGARRIDVEVESGGRRLIRVVDDGGGMTPDEARLALKRHATSKITAADDLWGLATFGFRGEALPSIAAVSRLSVSTKPAGATAGFRVVVEAGLETDAREVGIPQGTQVEVRDLFYNTPARQKFLKSESTEAANISEAVLRLALAHPEVHFRLRQNGRVAFDVPEHRDLAERVRAALARRGATVLHEASGEEGGYRVRAFLAGPDEASTTARSSFLFVGRRFVRDRSLLHALSLGYGALLEKGRYPLATLFLEVPGGELDVNVHPQKLEVRFARANEVYAAVRHVVGGALARAPWLEPQAARPVRVYTQPPWRTRAAPEPSRAADGPEPDGARPPLREAAPPPELFEGTRATRPAMRSPELFGDHGRMPESAAVVRGPAGDRAPQAPGPIDAAASSSTGTAAPVTPSPGRFFGELEYIGQLARTYLVCQSRNELVLVDQHAAHERIAFSRLRAAHSRREMRRQRLLFPIPIDVDETAAASADREALGALGFDVEPDGPRRLLLRAVPELLKDADPKPLLRDLLAQLGDADAPSSATDRVDHVLATLACHSVVRAGDVLSREEAIALLAQLDDVDLRSHCPHGRPVLLRLPLAEIERRFGRT